MRHYRLDVRHTSSDLAVAIELCEDARVSARVNLIEAWGVAPFDAASLAQKVRLLQSVLDDMGVLYDAAGAATLLEDACAFMRTHPLEEVGSYDDPGSREAPGFPVAKIQKERDRLYDLVARFAGKAPAGEVFDQLRQALAAAYALSPDAPAVFETVRALPPGPLAAKTLWLFAWRVASRHARLKKGEPIRPWTNQLQDEWTPFEIMDVEYRRTDRFGAGLMVTLRALAGTCCGMTVTKFWSNDQMSMHLRRLGFTHKGKARLPYKSMKQLVRLRLVALVSAEHSDEKPRFRGYEVVGGILAFNKKLLKARILRKPPCPMNYSHPCHVCPIGYALGSPTCPASVHPATWEYKSCPECGSDGWFDPVKPSEACIQCRQNMAARKAEAAPSR